MGLNIETVFDLCTTETNETNETTETAENGEE